MNRRAILLTAIAAVLVYIQTGVSSVSQEQPVLSEKLKPAGTELIAGYRNWTRVNPVPAIFDSRLAISCSIQAVSMEEKNPHRDKYVSVYVNDPGRRSMMEEREPRYPHASVIVKEKLTTRESTAPELLTVMMKRERGYNPENGDWEYMVFDGKGEKVFARGKLEKCQSCHQMYSRVDYVNRNYLPEELWDKLK